jgi:hypothetical protein
MINATNAVAPKGQNMLAQGETLGIGIIPKIKAPTGRNKPLIPNIPFIVDVINLRKPKNNTNTAPKGQNILAQGETLGIGVIPKTKAPTGRNKLLVPNITFVIFDVV